MGDGYYGNLGFIMPGAVSGDFSFLSETIAKISFKQIGQLVGLSLILYGYYKIVVTGYCYSQKLAFDESWLMKKRDNLEKFGETTQAIKDLVTNMNNSPNYIKIHAMQFMETIDNDSIIDFIVKNKY